MAKSTASTLISDILRNMGLKIGVAGDGSAERVDVLRELNKQNREILTKHSLRFMLTGPTPLAIASSSVAIPTTIDPSKTMLLTRSSSGEEIIYKAPDEWGMDGLDTYGGTTQTEPTTYTVIGPNFVFHPAGLSVNINYVAQLRVTALLDDGSSTSQLPEGKEDSILAVITEAELRRINNEPYWQELWARAQDELEAMYGSERTSKLVQKTDREQQERKVEKSQLSDEAPS